MTNAKAKILCVDDDPNLLGISSSILQLAGHQVIQASTGNECLHIARKEKPDLVLLDVILPDINGYDVCKKIKEDPALSGTYVILISGMETTSENQIKGLGAGADGYVVRPVSNQELLARVHAMIRIKQSETALRKSMEQYQRLVETMNDGMGIVDENGVNTFANKKFCEMLGYSPDEIIGHSSTDFLDEENQKIHREQFVKRKEGISTPYELVMMKKDGQKVFTIISPRPIFDDMGNFKGSFAIITDISYRKKNDEKIRKCNEELERRVIDRTKQLQVVIEELESEILERKRAEEKVQSYAKRLKTLSNRLIEVQEAERCHIAQELHDEIGQALTGLKFSIENIASLQAGDIAVKTKELQISIQEILNKVRNMSFDLRPSMLDDLGILPALIWLFERYSAQTKVRVKFSHNGLNERFSPEIETAVYRIVQEALTNVARHAKVNEAKVFITAYREMFEISIEDKGTGFDYEMVKNAPTAVGIKWMNERVALLNGELVIDSAPGAGTRLMAKIPIKGLHSLNREKTNEVNNNRPGRG